jgi:hypothetical protein
MHHVLNNRVEKLLLFCGIIGVLGMGLDARGSGFEVVFDPGLGSRSRVLQTLSSSSLGERPQKVAVEGGTYRGISVQSLLDDLTKPLSVEDRAHVDLVVFNRGKSEQKLLLPRAILVKFPGILISASKEKFMLVLPKDIHGKLQSEGILVESLGSREVTGVTLTSYDQRYGNVLLKRRTDPAAMRGEKLYVQNCLGCHQGARQKSEAMRSLTSPEKVKQFLVEGKHSSVSGVSSWSELLDQKKARSLASYLNAHQGEVSHD